MKSPVILRIFKDNKLVEVKQFDLDQIIIGNGGDVQISLSEETVSPIHCLFELRDSGYYICDLGSNTGTYKNGIQILDEPLSSGDQIGIGSYTLHFFVGVPKPKAPPVPAPPETKNDEKISKISESIVPLQHTQSPPSLEKDSNQIIKSANESEQATKTKINSKKTKTRHKKDFHTYAPESEIKDLKNFFKPTKGSVLEVNVAWKERIISTKHFSAKKNLMLGSSEQSDVYIPSTFLPKQILFIDQTSATRVSLTSNMSCEIVNNQRTMDIDELSTIGKAVKNGGGSIVRLDQNELLAISIGDGTVQIYIRHVPSTKSPIAAGLDLTAGEVTGLAVAFVMVSLFWLFMAVYGSTQAEEEKTEEQLHFAKFIYEKKEEKELKKAIVKENEKTATKIEVVDKKVEKPSGSLGQNNAANPKNAKAAEVRSNNTKNRQKKFTSTHHGGSVKTANKEGANAQSKVDVKQTGLLSAFSGGGNRTKLDQAYSGSGELMGMADKATGTSGQSTDRAGDDLGSKFKDTGAGGKGTATEGIAGVGTKGRSSGQSNYGQVGLGGKGNVAIDIGGAGEEFVGTVDKAAVRRVVMSIINQIKNCYDRGLRSNSELEGKVIIHWSVYEQGRVKLSNVKDAPPELKSVGECVALRIKEQRFPDPPAGSYYEVDYPFAMGKQK